MFILLIHTKSPLLRKKSPLLRRLNGSTGLTDGETNWLQSIPGYRREGMVVLKLILPPSYETNWPMVCKPAFHHKESGQREGLTSYRPCLLELGDKLVQTSRHCCGNKSGQENSSLKWAVKHPWSPPPPPSLGKSWIHPCYPSHSEHRNITPLPTHSSNSCMHQQHSTLVAPPILRWLLNTGGHVVLSVTNRTSELSRREFEPCLSLLKC